MKTLFFDFETTGKILRRELLNDPAQPRAVSVGLLLVADGYGVIGQSKFLIKPDGFVIPDDVVKVHGITTQMATAIAPPIAPCSEPSVLKTPIFQSPSSESPILGAI